MIGPHGGLYIEVPGKACLINDLARGQHFARSAEVRQWRDAAQWAAKALRVKPLRPPVVVYIHDLYRGRAHDVAAVLFAAKGFQDGTVDAGLLPDDNPRFVRGLFFLAPVKADRDALGLELVEQ